MKSPQELIDFLQGKVKKAKDGKDGKDGYTPKKGVDYFDGNDGRDGKDGINGRDGKNGINGKDGLNGNDGHDGKDGVDAFINIEQIIEEIIKLKIPLSAIQENEKLMKVGSHIGKKINTNDERWHGGGSGNYFNNVENISSDKVLPISGGIYFVNASAGKITITLPTASGQKGVIYKIKKIDTSNNSVIINPINSQTIDDETNIDVADYNNAPELVSDGANWKIT